MKLLILIIILTSLLIFPQNKWTKLNGPEGGFVTALYSKGDTVLAGSEKGRLFFSVDRGQNWVGYRTNVNERVRDLTYGPDGAIYSAVGNNLYKSFDLISWSSTGFKRDYERLFTDYKGTIYGGSTSEITLSLDSGATWRTNFIDPLSVTSFDLLSGNVLLAGIGNRIIRKDVNFANWKTVYTDTTIPSGAGYRRYLVIAGDNGVAFAQGGTNVLISQDTGLTWQNQSIGSFFNGNQMYGAVYNKRIIGAFGDETNLFGSGWGAAVSDDEGLNWKWSQEGLPFKISGARIIKSGDDTYLGTNAAGVFKSTDFGESWFSVNNGIYAAQTIKVIIDKDDVLYAASWSNGLSRSTDYGDTWEMINNGVNNVYFLSIVSDGEGNLLAGSEQGIYRSTDKGENWIKTSAAGNNFGYELHKDKYNRIYALIYGNGLYRTTDLGNNWERLDKEFISSYVFGFATDKDDNLYAGTNGGALYKSPDDGANWTKIYQSSVDNSSIGAVAISPLGDIFLTNHEEGIIRSTDSGQSWKLVKEEKGRIYPNFILSINSKGEIFTKGSNESIYKSTDNGENWEDITSNAYLVNVNNFTLDEKDNLYLATDESVWRSNPDSLTTIAEDESSTPKEYTLSQNYPNPFNPTTIIKYQIPEHGYVTLKIYDILGKEIATLVNEEKTAGRYEVNFDASNLSSGVYIYQVKVNDFVSSRKMVLMK